MFGASLLWGRLPGCAVLRIDPRWWHPFLWIIASGPQSFRSGLYWSSRFCALWSSPSLAFLPRRFALAAQSLLCELLTHLANHFSV